MIKQVKAIIDKSLPLMSNLSNVSAILFKQENINWAGFYLVDGDTLYLGPFQGDVACTRIPMGKGVCGTSFLKKETIIVDDVTKFKGHIACSSLSKSEIVVPIIKNNQVKAVIDIDSPVLNRFNKNDKDQLEEISKILGELF
ncbi:MAG: GAF domain-containing protein [Bacilli bacterium]|nr:GAF domain-containing protein [Bacilli bacterium]